MTAILPAPASVENLAAPPSAAVGASLVELLRAVLASTGEIVIRPMEPELAGRYLGLQRDPQRLPAGGLRDSVELPATRLLLVLPPAAGLSLRL